MTSKLSIVCTVHNTRRLHIAAFRVGKPAPHRQNHLIGQIYRTVLDLASAPDYTLDINRRD
jgi:hypothetical protein